MTGLEIHQHVVEKRSFLIASQVAFFRKQRGMTQKDLAMACGIEQSALARLEKTPDTQWTSPTLLKLAAALDVRVSVDLIPNEKVRPLLPPEGK